MKRFLLATGLFAAFLVGDWQAAVDPSSSGGSFVRSAAAYDNDAYQDFYQALQPYGQWVATPQYGQVWIPANMPQGWRPYTNGHWDYTDQYGWMWVSDYEWGWAPFHYGRWTFDQQYGWMWVPGRTWGPAWVSFRYGDSYVGWAPLPPEGYDDVPSYGYEPTINVAFWNFVPRQHFNDRYVDRYYGNYRENNNYYYKTKNVTNITVINNRVVNNSINVNNFERDTRQRVVRRQVDVADTFVPGKQRQRGNDLVVVRPKDVERNAGKPKIQWQQYGNRNQGDQNGGGNNANNGKNWNNGNNGDNGQRTVTNQGKPKDQNQQGPAVILPPNGKPDNSHGAAPNNGQGGNAQTLRNNDNNNNNKAYGNANNGRNKPAPVIIPPPENGNNRNQGQPQNFSQTNNGDRSGNDARKKQQQVQQQLLKQQQQQQQLQQVRQQQQIQQQQQLQKNNGQGRGQQNNPPAHGPQKKRNDCGNNANCND